MSSRYLHSFLAMVFLLTGTAVLSQPSLPGRVAKAPLACTPTTTTIAFQGGEGSGADNWNFLPITPATSIARLKPGITTDFARSGAHSIRAGGGDISGCTDPSPGQNCITGTGNARGCPKNDSIIQFENKDVTCYSDVQLSFYHGNQETCNGSGFDGEDSLYVEVRLDNGQWTRIFTMSGSSVTPFNYKWTFATTNPGGDLKMPNPVVYYVPLGTKQFAFRTVGRLSRSDEVYYIDDVSLTGKTICGPVITTQPNAAPVCANTSITIPVVATSLLPITYQWQVNTGSGWTNIAAGSPYSVDAEGKLTINPVLSSMDGYRYQVILSNSCDVPTLSDIATLAVKPGPSVPTSPSASPSDICAGSGNVTLAATFGSGETLEWFSGSCGGTPVGTGSPLLIAAPSSTTTYFTRATGTCGSSACTQVTVTAGSAVTPTIQITPSAPRVCAGSTADFSVTATNTGTSPVYLWKINGLPAGGNSTTFSSSTLSNNDVVSCELTSSDACASPKTVTDQVAVIVDQKLAPSISILPINPQICAGSNVDFNASFTNAGLTPVFQWKINGSPAGSNSARFSGSTLNNNDVVSCELISSDDCADPKTAKAQTSVTVKTAIVPSITISTGSNSVCAGQNVIFASIHSGEGSSPMYEWKINGIKSGTNSDSFSTNTLTNGSAVSCTLTSSEACASPAAINSNSITINVAPVIVPEVLINPDVASACSGKPVSFTATPSGGGISPAYQWFVNGTAAGSNSASFSSSALASTDIVTCKLTSSETCASPKSANSPAKSVIISPSLAPAVNVTASSTLICTGTPVIFTADTANAGQNPAYQWMLNGVNVGSNSISYTNNSLSNGDKVSCRLTSSYSCASPADATSAAVAINVNTKIIPSASIQGPAKTPCPGEMASFAVTAAGQGTAPVYEWKLNGVVSGTNSPSFSSNTLKSGDNLECSFISSESCADPQNASSPPFTVVIGPSIVPSISIKSSSDQICPGTPVNFSTAMLSGEGSSPSFQWQVNGVNSGSNSPAFTGSMLNDGDNVSCILTSSDGCANPKSITATAINITVTTHIIPAVSIIGTPNPSAAGEMVSFTATPSGQGVNPVYQWKLNGVNTGSGGTTFASNSLNDGDRVTCELTSSESCAKPPNANSAPVIIKIKAALAPVFNPVNPLCLHTLPPLLPAVSNNSISGTWNPASISTAAAGTYDYRFTPDPGQNALQYTMSIMVNDLPAISLSDDDVAFTPSLVLDAGSPGTGSYVYLWQYFDEDYWINEGTGQTLAVPKPGSYRVIVTDAAACSDTVTVKVRPPGVLMLVPNAFTPDGNGTNDIFKPIFPAGEPDSYLMLIYNKWGQLLFTSTNTELGWDGKFNKVLSPPGAYVYHIHYSNRMKTSDTAGEARRGIFNLVH